MSIELKKFTGGIKMADNHMRKDVKLHKEFLKMYFLSISGHGDPWMPWAAKQNTLRDADSSKVKAFRLNLSLVYQTYCIKSH